MILFCLGESWEYYYLLLLVTQHHLRWKQTILFQIKQNISWKLIVDGMLFISQNLCFFQSILSKPGAVFHFLPPQNAQHTENPSITNPRSNFLSALCFTHKVLLDWKDESLTHIRYALFSNHDKLQKEKGSPLRSGLYETPSLLVPGFLERKKNTEDPRFVLSVRCWLRGCF